MLLTWLAFIIFLLFILLLCGVLALEILRVACASGIPSTPSTRSVVETVVRHRLLPSTGLILDLGCGFGWTLWRLSKSNLRGPFIGYEKSLVPWFMGRLWRALTRSRVTIVRGDLDSAPIEQARGIYLFLLPSVLERLGLELRRRAAPGTRIVCAEFALPSWQPQSIYTARGITSRQAKIFVYEVGEKG